MLPFDIRLEPGRSVYEQVVYAVNKAFVLGRLRPGDRFPSVRKLSQELKINPNTAQKIVAHLKNEGLLAIQPGIGAIVTARPRASRRERASLLGTEMERIVVSARQLGLHLPEMTQALEEHWKALESGPRERSEDVTSGGNQN